MIQDLHSHTYYSFCGRDEPCAVVEAAIAGGVELFGICDHSYGIGNARKDVNKYENPELGQDYYRTLRRYFDHISLVREKYADKIKILRGIEVATHQWRLRAALPDGTDISFFDYCLVEGLDDETSITGGDIFTFAARCGCPTAVAHTDLFAHIAHLGERPEDYFRRMAEQNIFWEINVNYDSVHHFEEHEYVKRFFADEAQQVVVRESGVRLSVGFDGHRVEEYNPARVQEACERIHAMGIKLAFEE